MLGSESVEILASFFVPSRFSSFASAVISHAYVTFLVEEILY